MRYNQELSHPDDIGFNLRHVIRATSGSFVCHPDDIVHWPKSHPDEILPRAKSSGRLRDNFPSYVIRMTYCTGNESIDSCMHIVLGLARSLDLHITVPLWGNPTLMRLFETDTALSWDWTICWSINQITSEFRSCGTPVTSLECHRETLNN